MNRKNDLVALTALKGIFCLVIAFHNTMLIQFLFDYVPGASFLRLFGGHLGNSIFLTISGFLFAYNYRERIQNHEIPFPQFLKRRLARLYPLYLITNLVSLAVSIVMYGPSAINLTKIAFMVLLVDGSAYNTPTWFLAVIFVCYILFYCVCYHTKNRTQYFSAIALLAVLGATLKTELPFLTSTYCFAYLNFFVGCILAEVLPMVLRTRRRWRPHLCVVLLGLMAYLLMGYGVEIIAGDVQKAFSLMITPLILFIALSDSIYSRILQIRPLVFLGKISTSVYFWHLPGFFIFRDLAFGGPITEVQYLIYLALLLGLSVLSYRYIENRRKPVTVR